MHPAPESTLGPSEPNIVATAKPAEGAGRYVAKLASGPDEVRAAQALRYAVFNVELGEGLPSSNLTGLDIDEFDVGCDHLTVSDSDSGQVVGTYRLQTGEQAKRHLGYYCEREFDFKPFEPYRAEVLELGRACIHADHRNFSVLAALWRGIASYAKAQGSRYMVGCSSLTSQDPLEAAAAYQALTKHLAPPHLRTLPRPPYALDLPEPPKGRYKLPRLLSAYLIIGSEICGPPAIDREFKTIDFLTVFDLVKIRMNGKSGWLRFERE